MTIPGQERLLFICLRAHLLTRSDKVVARYQLHSRGKKTVLLSHTQGWGWGRGPRSPWKPVALWRRGRVWGIAFVTQPEFTPQVWGLCPSWSLFSVWLWMALTSHLGSHEIHWSPLCKLQALRHGNESVTVAVLQENFCLSLNESTEALNLQSCLINKGAAFYM